MIGLVHHCEFLLISLLIALFSSEYCYYCGLGLLMKLSLSSPQSVAKLQESRRVWVGHMKQLYFFANLFSKT